MAAFPDSEGLVCYQTFIGVWRKSDRYDEWALSAILNSPVASAFVATREGKTDITLQTLRNIPMPRFTSMQLVALRDLIREYQQTLIDFGSQHRSEGLLKEIDALVLKGYGMPPRLERELLEFFRGHARPTAHEFGEYFPQDCNVYFSLSDFLSPEFSSATAGELLKRLL
jgi:hypothetical protein